MKHYYQYTISTVLVLIGIVVQGATYYVSPTGDDNDPGSELSPWRTIAASVNRLSAGDTLYMREGTYYESNINVTCTGTEQSPITIKNYPGEKPVIDGAIEELQNPDSNTWVLVDGNKNIYRTADEYTSDQWDTFCGGKFEFEGENYSLVAYSNRRNRITLEWMLAYDYLESDDHTYNKNTPRYMGPGVAYGGPTGEDNYIYIRLIPCTAQSTYDVEFDIPDDPDPSQYSISICNYSHGLDIDADSQYIVFEGITMANHMYEVSGPTKNWTFRNLTLTPALGGFVFANNDSHNILVDGVTMNLLIPPWLGWTDIKGVETPAVRNRTGGISFSGSTAYSHDIEVKNCTFNGVFDAFLPCGAEYNLYIHHNTINGVWDDFIQLGSATYNVEVAYNLICGAGPSHESSGTSVYPGMKYFHHNVIDCSEQILWTRYDEVRQLRIAGERGWRGPIPIPAHGSGGNDPWKLYQNTFITADIVSGYLEIGEFMENTTGVKHEAYNNIIYMTCRRYVSKAWQVHDGGEIYDGNLYWRDDVGIGFTPFFLDVWNATDSANYNCLADFMNSARWEETQAYYGPGWENSGVEADPLLNGYMDGDYRPAWNSPAASGAVDISSKGWPGTTAMSWRGALPVGFEDETTNLVGHWKLNEGTGTTAADSSAGEHDGTLYNGPEWINGKANNALAFHNASSTVQVPNHSDFNFGTSTDFSISTWIRVDTKETGKILYKRTIGSGYPGYILYVRLINGIAYLRGLVTDGAHTCEISTSGVDDGKWHHIVLLVDRDGYVTYYVDGSFAVWSQMGNVGNMDNTCPVIIGENFPGAIDDIRIYQRLLSIDEIESLYAMGAVGSGQ